LNDLELTRNKERRKTPHYLTPVAFAKEEVAV
jgi:hypothetical protein